MHIFRKALEVFGMKLEGSYTFKASRQAVWRHMLDPEHLAKCLPGGKALEKIGDNRYRAEMTIGVAAIKGTYTGTIELLDMREPEHYKMVVEGSGGPGFVKGEGELELEEVDGSTKVTYKGEATVGGTIAGVGQRMLGGVAKLLIDQFFKCMEKQVLEGK